MTKSQQAQTLAKMLAKVLGELKDTQYLPEWEVAYSAIVDEVIPNINIAVRDEAEPKSNAYGKHVDFEGAQWRFL